MRRHYKFFIFVLLLFLSIGFAYLTANLDVTGTIAFRENTWDVHLDNIVVEYSLDADAPTINTDKDTVNFNISFTRPGDYYEFYVDVVNAGTMDASLESTVKSTLTGNYLTNLDYNVTYYSDRALTKGDLLRAGCKERIKVRVEYKYDVDTYTKLDDINLFFKVNYIKTDTHASTYNAKVWNFDSKGEEDTFTVPKTGKYKLEVWGAQGGTIVNNTTSYSGGYGGYSVGNINLNLNQKIYLNVGTKGIGSIERIEETIQGGYNGGGFAGSYKDKLVASGGGATHVAFSPGLLATLENNKNSIIIVAGGGGGSSYQNADNKGLGGSGGGYIGNNGTSSIEFFGRGGTQIAGGEGYKGGNGINNGLFGMASADAYNCSGGGSGYFGGGGGRWYSGAGGGSGYIGNTNLTDKIMYCYNCQSSENEEDETNIKTRSTTNVSETPTSNYAKIGDGYARITYVGN